MEMDDSLRTMNYFLKLIKLYRIKYYDSWNYELKWKD